jgi:CrcB protein
MFSTVLQVAVGGAIGAVARFGVSALVVFPIGTLAVNVVGSFLIGVLWVWAASRGAAALPFLMTGVLGGFTTFSAFSLDTMRLVEDGRITGALGYVLASVMLSLLACALGLWIAKGALA